VQARWRARVSGFLAFLASERPGGSRAREMPRDASFSRERPVSPRLSFFFSFPASPSSSEAAGQKPEAPGVALHRELSLRGSTPRQQANRSCRLIAMMFLLAIHSLRSCAPRSSLLPVSRFYSVSFSVSSSLSCFSRVLSHSHSPSLALSFDIEVLLEFRFVSRFRFFL